MKLFLRYTAKSSSLEIFHRIYVWVPDDFAYVGMAPCRAGNTVNSSSDWTGCDCKAGRCNAHTFESCAEVCRNDPECVSFDLGIASICCKFKSRSWNQEWDETAIACFTERISLSIWNSFCWNKSAVKNIVDLLEIDWLPSMMAQIKG